MRRLIGMASEPERRALDELAGDLLRTLGGLEFRPALSPEEIEATYRLRHDAVIANGWATLADYPDGREYDADDARAVHVICRDGERIVGSLRLVPATPGHPLPTERDFELELAEGAPTVDAGRVVVAPSHRGAIGQLILSGLVARGWLEARALGADRIVGVATPSAIALYHELGLSVAVLGSSRSYWGEQRQPIEIVGAATAAEDHEQVALATAADGWTAPEPGVSRRRLLATMGAATAGSIALLGLPEVAAAATPSEVGSGPSDRRTVDFVARIDQTGTQLVALGYLTRVAGLPSSVLFTKPPATSTADPGSLDTTTARFAVTMRAKIESISALGTAIAGHGAGTTEIHFLPDGGASLDQPASFSAGNAVAAFRLLFQHSLAIDAPNRAMGGFAADLTQLRVRSFAFDGRRYQLGKAGLPWSLRAAGRGERTEPTTPVSQHFVAGDMGVVDAVRR